MSQKSIFTLSQPKDYLILTFWLFLVVFGGRFIIKDAIPYFGLDPEVLGRWLDFKWPLIGHISGGIIALVLGPFQFWKTLRNKYLKAHRISGRVYVGAIMVAVISSTYLSWTSALAISWPWALALQTLAFVWFLTTAMALISVKRKRMQQHQEWMIRSYVVTFAFVTFRFLSDMPAIQALGPFTEYGPAVGWVSWTIPLLITEVLISWKKPA